MAKGYTKRLLAKQPRASARGRIVRHGRDGRVIMEITRPLPDGTRLLITQHATKGIRVERLPRETTVPGVIQAEV